MQISDEIGTTIQFTDGESRPACSGGSDEIRGAMAFWPIPRHIANPPLAEH
jgi:hypothetical protein